MNNVSNAVLQSFSILIRKTSSHTTLFKNKTEALFLKKNVIKDLFKWKFLLKIFVFRLSFWYLLLNYNSLCIYLLLFKSFPNLLNIKLVFINYFIHVQRTKNAVSTAVTSTILF